MTYTGEQKRAYQLEWMRKRRQGWIDSQGGKCKQCGSTDMLEVDHIDPTTKSMNPRSIWSRTASVREAELVKCQVLCKTCHDEKTIASYTPAEHGTVSRYGGKYQCRCTECREAGRLQKAEWRSRQ